MASTYSSLKIELIGTGEQSGTWGDTTNINLGTAIEEAITGSADVNFATDADVTITLTSSNTAQTARNLRLNITESSTGVGSVRNLILGSGCQIEKLYLINNTGTGAKTIKNTTGTGVTVPAGKTMFVFNNGTNVVDATTHLSSLTLGSALPVTSGGTGVTTSTGTGNVVLSTSPTLTTPTLTTPILGTPTSGTLTSCTGLPLTTGVTGTLPATNGGTGQSSYAVGDLIYASTTTALSKLADVATGSALISGGVGVVPSWGKIGLTTHVSGTLPVTSGGTGASTQTAYSVLCGGTTSTGAYQSVASVGTSGQVLTSNGAGALPTFQANGNGTVTSVSWTGGIVSVATSTTTPAFTIAGTSGGIPYFSSGTTWASSAALAASALVIGGGAGVAPSTTTTGTGVITALGLAVNTGSGGLITNTGTATLTNKRITPRSLAAANTSGAITPNSDLYDQVNYLLNGTSSFSNPSGTPTNGQKLTIRLYAASTQTISSWSSSSGGYRAIGTTLEASVPAGKTMYVGCIWNSTDSFWDVVSVAVQI
jgi:hypothetical protein